MDYPLIYLLIERRWSPKGLFRLDEKVLIFETGVVHIGHGLRVRKNWLFKERRARFMRRNWPSKTLIIVFVPLLFILSWGPCFSQDTTGLTKDTIKIGQFGSLTGETYIFGKLAFNGADLVYNEVNDKGGHSWSKDYYRPRRRHV
jgi:hypothetical protein